MMTSPFNDKLHNIKPREVWCPSCKKTTVTDDMGPICEECFGVPMLTVVFSLIDGKRLTGDDELGSGDSKSS